MARKKSTATDKNTTYTPSVVIYYGDENFTLTQIFTSDESGVEVFTISGVRSFKLPAAITYRSLDGDKIGYIAESCVIEWPEVAAAISGKTFTFKKVTKKLTQERWSDWVSKHQLLMVKP